jgi:hypothetical protein
MSLLDWQCKLMFHPSHRGVVMNHAERQQGADMIASLERQVIALKRVGGHSIEILACEEAIGHLKTLFQSSSGTPLHGKPKPTVDGTEQ